MPFVSFATCFAIAMSSSDRRRKIMEHEPAFVSVFVVPKKRPCYAEFLSKPKLRGRITTRFSHFFDFMPALAKQVPRGTAEELAPLLRAKGAGATAHLIGGKEDGKDLPLLEALDSALADPSGVVVSCLPGRLALYIQEFPPGDTFVLYYNCDS